MMQQSTAKAPINDLEDNLPIPRSIWYVTAMEMLVDVVRDLSLQRDLAGVMGIVRRAARALTGADGATFVLREDDKCFYAEENAIGPLWKGQRFPISTCVSGWAMIHREVVSIEDIYQDSRVPIDAYRPTFVKSLVMVPVGAQNPIGAIGNYWATKHLASNDELQILQALADVASVALANADLYIQLQNKLAALEKSNEELERFAWVASHDLKSPLRAIENLSQWAEEDAEGTLPEKSREHLSSLRQRVARMDKHLDDILEFARIEHQLDASKSEFALGSQLLRDIEALIDMREFNLTANDAFRHAVLPRLPLARVFSNLVDNAVKHHDGGGGTITFSLREEGPNDIFTISDDGPGIPEAYHQKIFDMFQTLKPRDKVEGSGMGLAVVRKLLTAYRGTIRVETGTAGNGRGASFIITWPRVAGELEQAKSDDGTATEEQTA